MNLGDRVYCGVITPIQIGLTDRKVQNILAETIDATAITINGAPMCYNDMDGLPSADTVVSDGSANLVTSGAVHAAIETSSNSKQDILTVNGLPIHPQVLGTFALAASGVGTGYMNSLVTASAIENWFESLQDNLLMVVPGQDGPGFRASSISSTSPSATNVPSCIAVSNHLSARLSAIVPLPKFTGSENPTPLYTFKK